MHTLSLNFKILQFYGMWRPLMWSSGWKSTVYNLYTTIMVSCFYTYALTLFVDLVVSSENVKEFTHGSYMFLSILAGCGKSANVIKQRKKIIDITNVLQNDLCRPRNDDEIKIQTDCERDARSNTLWYSALGGITVSLIILRSCIVDIPERNMLFKSWLPYDVKSSETGFLLAYIHQVIAHSTGAAINSTFDTLVPGFMMETCAQIKILKYRIESLPRIVEARRTLGHETNEESVRERQSLEMELLTECIRHHVQIFQLADSVNEVFSNVVFLQFALSSLILCVSAYETSAMKLFSAEFAALMLYLCCMLVQIFVYCFYGGELTLQSVDICDAVYRMDQSLLSIRTKKSLVMVMMRSLRPITFTCGHIITVSIDSFNQLLKLSYSVYNVLQRASDEMDTLSLNFKILQIYGMWGSSFWSVGWKAMVYNSYTIVMISCLYSFALSEFIDLLVSSENAKEFAHGSYMFLSILGGCGKCATVIKQRKKIIDLMNMLRNDLCRPRNSEEVQIQAAYEREARLITSWFSTLCGITVILITLKSLILDVPERNTPFKGWLPYDRQSSEIGFWLAYFHQLVALYTGAAINSTFDTLVPGFMMQTCAQIKILKYRIESLPQTADSRILQHEKNHGEYFREWQSRESQLLIDCIRHHVEIFQFADTLNDIFSNIVFFQFALSSLVLCVSAYETSGMKLFSAEFAALSSYLCCMLVQIFVYSFYGGELTLQSVDICDAIYRMDQTFLSIKIRKNLIMMMMRALRPITFTCGNVITVSLVSFNKLIKLSYSVYNILQYRMDMLKLNFKILIFCGMWRPSTWSVGSRAVFYNCYTILMALSLYTFLLSQLVGLILTSENAAEFSHGSYMLFAVIASSGKSLTVMKQHERIIHLMKVLRNDLCRPRDKEEMKIQADCEREARFNTFWYSALGGTTVSLLTLKSLIVDIPERTVPFIAWHPFDLKTSKVGFWLAYFHQLVALYTGAAINSTFDTLVPGFMMQTCAQIKILKYRIESLPQTADSRKLQHEKNHGEYLRERQSRESELLIECIKHHVEIFQFADTLNDIFSNIVFLQFALSSLVLCVTAYETSGMKLFSAEFAALSSYLCCMLVQIFIYSFYGGELTLQSLDICEAVYRMDHVVLSIRIKKNLVMIMMRALRPITFTCGNLITVSLVSFNKLIKLSYSVYNLLQRTTE
ncbi:uncharacterized protein [Venturia canescens]|uniref:uncharacterized protein n=1 Tax=Venturia canescens TaxID=32260 RepID=UPI001C9CE2B3|nr:uncharacterized protein LOC122416614 [Venturia canescens]